MTRTHHPASPDYPPQIDQAALQDHGTDMESGPVESASVVMPTLNQARYLRAAIDSVLGQERDFELECIVMDGGSSDGTLEILQSYGSAIKWVSRPDGGQSDALNRGLRLSTGSVLGWLNSDDLYEPGALRRAVEVFRSEPTVQWAYGRVRIVDERGREIRRFVTAYKNWRMKHFTFEKLLVENWISQMGVFWRRSAWQLVGDFRTDLHLAMDYDYWLRLGKRWPAQYIPEYLGAFRWYVSSKSGSQFRQQSDEELRIAKRHAGDHHEFLMFLHRMQTARTVAAYRVLRSIGR